MTWIVLIKKRGLRSFHTGTEAEIHRLASVFFDHVVDGPREMTERETLTGAMRGAPFGLELLPDESLRAL